MGLAGHRPTIFYPNSPTSLFIATDYRWLVFGRLLLPMPGLELTTSSTDPFLSGLDHLYRLFSLAFHPCLECRDQYFRHIEGKLEEISRKSRDPFHHDGERFYLLTCIQGPLMALRNINEITSKTDWVIGHSHISLFATFTFFASAGV